MDKMIRLTVTLSDGRELSGVYDYLSALSRLEFAKKLPNFVSYTMRDA